MNPLKGTLLHTKEGESSQLMADLAAMKQANSDLAANIDGRVRHESLLNEKLAAMTKERDDNDRTIENLRAHLRGADAGKANLRAKLAEAEVDREQLALSRERMKANFGEMKSALADIHEQRARAEAAEAALAAMTKCLKSARAEAAHAQSYESRSGDLLMAIDEALALTAADTEEKK